MVQDFTSAFGVPVRKVGIVCGRLVSCQLRRSGCCLNKQKILDTNATMYTYWRRSHTRSEFLGAYIQAVGTSVINERDGVICPRVRVLFTHLLAFWKHVMPVLLLSELENKCVCA